MKLVCVGEIHDKKYKLFVVKDIREIKLDYASYICPVCGRFGNVEFVKYLKIYIDNGEIIEKFDDGRFVFRCDNCSFWDVIEDIDIDFYVVGTRVRDHYLEIYVNDKFYEEAKKHIAVKNVIDSAFDFDYLFECF
jgi:hypothetical protein